VASWCYKKMTNDGNVQQSVKEPKSCFHSSSWSTTASTAFSTSVGRATFLSKTILPKTPELHPRTSKALWRDLIFVIMGCIAISIVSYVETYAPDAKARYSPYGYEHHQHEQYSGNPYGIVDTGYILTHPLYEWLRMNRNWNDTLAVMNSIALVIPSFYVLYITNWKGDYSLSFRIIFVQLLRSFCGWFTYLPPDPTYLNSRFDFPDLVHCLFQECETASGSTSNEVMPFVSFFSGHVASLAVVGNHMWLTRRYKSAIIIHLVNLLQIVRLLATRGHYSIDIIIGWFVAVYVSNPAGKLGQCYSRGATMYEMMMPNTPREAFEHVTGITHSRNESRMTLLLRRPEVQDLLCAILQDETNSDDYSSESETTARIFQKMVLQLVSERAEIVQHHVNHLQLRSYSVVEQDGSAEVATWSFRRRKK